MRQDKYQKGRLIYEQSRVKLVSTRPLIFEVDGQQVTKTIKGWFCSYKEDYGHYERRKKIRETNCGYTPTRWSCSFNRGVRCSHIIACELFILNEKKAQD